MITFVRRASLIGLVALASASSCLGYQMGGMFIPNAAARQPNPAAAKTAAEREQVARDAVAALEELEKKGEAANSSPNLLAWKKRLIDAQRDGGKLTPELAKTYAKDLRAAESHAKIRFDQKQISRLEYLEAKFRAAEAEGIADETNPGPQQGFGGMGGGMGGPGGMGGGMGGGFGGMGVVGAGDGDTGESAPRSAPKEDPRDAARNKAINEKLETPLTMNFADETPLADVIKYIKHSLSTKDGKSVPIFLSPTGLQEAEKSMTSPITLELEGVPLRTTLRLALNQLGLDYRVREGMIFISSVEQFEEEEQPDFRRLSGLQ